MKWNNIKVPSLGHIYKQIKKVLLENLETDYVLILEDMKKHRSTEISTHFHSHVYTIYKELKAAGINTTVNKIYFECLLLACEMETVEGASAYPYEIIERNVDSECYNHDTQKNEKIIITLDILEPLRTSNRTNKEMMQAVEATHRYASVIVIEKYGLSEGIILPEKEEDNEISQT
jgi:hypothetical protein